MIDDEPDNQVSKKSVNYRPKSGEQRCGNCVMYHHGTYKCDLVKGDIYPNYVCNKWEAK